MTKLSPNMTNIVPFPASSYLADEWISFAAALSNAIAQLGVVAMSDHELDWANMWTDLDDLRGSLHLLLEHPDGQKQLAESYELLKAVKKTD